MTDKGTILVVDDTPADLNRLVDSLTAHGYRASPAETGELALASVVACPPELILLDIRGAGLDGFDVCRRLKARDQTRDIPVVFMSAPGEGPERAEASKLGAADFISKPIQHEELLARVRTQLELRRLRIRLEEQAGELRRANERLQGEPAGSQSPAAFRAPLNQDEDVRASRRLIEQIINAIPARVFWKDHDLVYLGCNAAFARDAGCADPKDVIGKDDYQMPWRDQAELYRSDDRNVLETACSKLLIEEPQTTPEGNRITLLTSKVPLRNSEGEVSGVLGTYLDVSERTRGEEALRASELRYRRLFESAKDGILILDAETGKIADVNPFLVELMGYSREEFLSRKIWELGFFKDVLASRDNFAELQQKKYLRHDDLALEAKDGRRLDVEFVSNVYHVNHEKVIQCNIRDITDRKRAEESHIRLATAAEQSGETIMITEVDGSIVYVNPAFEKATGYTREEVVGQNPRILKSGKQDAKFYRQMWAALSRGHVWKGRLSNKKKDGTLFDEDATISPVRDAAGKVVNYVAVKRDITNETRLEHQLFQAQKMDAVGSLAGGIAHDFNNLLGVIQGYGEIVHAKLSGEDPLRGKVEQILKAAERAAGLTRQLLAFGRRQVLQPRILDLSAVVSDMDKMLRRLIGEDIELTTLADPQLASVRADPGQIEQVVMNLAVNSRDAMPDGGRLTIETRNAELDADYAATHPSTRAGSYVMLAVTDTGSGMDASTQARIFEPFFTTKAAGKGTGLGLSTVYGIVKQSDGYVWVYSEPGVGTTFKIYLPCVDEEAPRAVEHEPGRLLRGYETVLLVEDEESLRELLRETLEAHGYSVLVARNGAEALQIAEAHGGPIQIMVTDVIMPGMAGSRVAELVSLARPEMKVLFISGYSDESVTRHGLVGPGRAFLSKPFGGEALLRCVRESLDEVEA
jgi:two-component system cell cycle sensor histidine kinase/response regulator CckA